MSIAPLQVHYSSEVLPTKHGHCVRVSHRSTTAASEGLAQGPNVAARAGFESMTLWMYKGDESTNEPPCHNCCCYLI